MKNLLQTLCGLFLVVFYSSCMNSGDNRVDVLIVGGGASGVTSGIQAARNFGRNYLVGWDVDFGRCKCRRWKL